MCQEELTLAPKTVAIKSNNHLCNTVNVDGADGRGDKWQGGNQLQLEMCLYAAAQVYHDKCHSKINSLCIFGNYSYHLGVIYLLCNPDRALCSSFWKFIWNCFEFLVFRSDTSDWYLLSNEIWTGGNTLDSKTFHQDYVMWLVSTIQRKGDVVMAGSADGVLAHLCPKSQETSRDHTDLAQFP